VIAPPPSDGMRNGGGAVLEVLVALTALGAAALAVLAVRRPPKRGRKDADKS
jgi:hypothetical protein